MTVNFDNFNSIVNLFEYQAENLSIKPYLWKKNNKEFDFLTWNKVKSMVDQIAKSLSSLGILEGDRVIILSENRPEWQISDLAIMSIGAITVHMYTTSTSDDYLHILKHSGARCAIVSNNELMKKILPAIEESQVCQNVIKIDNDNMTYKEIVNITSWDTILSESFSLEKKINNIKRS